jgi:hypothetical protein
LYKLDFYLATLILLIPCVVYILSLILLIFTSNKFIFISSYSVFNKNSALPMVLSKVLIHKRLCVNIYLNMPQLGFYLAGLINGGDSI